MNKEEPIKVVVSDGAITYELTIEKWAVNRNTKQWLFDEINKFLNEILGGKE